MSYVLGGTTIKRPTTLSVGNDAPYSQYRALDGTYTRDYFGAKKRIWNLEYDNIQVSDFNTINSIYQSYMSTETPKSFTMTESNYAVSSTTVHMDLEERGFTIGGSSALSSFNLVLTES